MTIRARPICIRRCMRAADCVRQTVCGRPCAVHSLRRTVCRGQSTASGQKSPSSVCKGNSAGQQITCTLFFPLTLLRQLQLRLQLKLRRQLHQGPPLMSTSCSHHRPSNERRPIGRQPVHLPPAGRPAQEPVGGPVGELARQLAAWGPLGCANSLARLDSAANGELEMRRAPKRLRGPLFTLALWPPISPASQPRSASLCGPISVPTINKLVWTASGRPVGARD